MTNKILIVDDDANVLSGIKRHLRGEFAIVATESGNAGLQALQNSGPFSVVVSDYNMPNMSGLEFLSKARALAPDTARIMLTGQGNLTVAIKAINEDEIFRFLTKPCSIEDLTRAIRSGLAHYRLLNAERELLEKTLNGSVKAFSDILALSCPIAFSRSARIRDLARAIAAQLDVEKPWAVEVAALLSHIGLITIPGDTLEKLHNGRPLSDKEKKMIEEHPLHGSKLLKSIPRLEDVANGIAFQEKRYDGTGFPYEPIKGKDIPLIARILKVALDFDRLVTAGKAPEQALVTMIQNARHYDQDALSALNAIHRDAGYSGVKKLVLIPDLKPGLTLAADIRTTTGALLVMKDQELTEVLIQRLMNFYQNGNVDGAVTVREMPTK